LGILNSFEKELRIQARSLKNFIEFKSFTEAQGELSSLKEISLFKYARQRSDGSTKGP
jgi:hypothetical protein